MTMAKQYYMSQEVLFQTTLFGKQYFWMKDGDGVIYLAKVGDDGQPDFS